MNLDTLTAKQVIVAGLLAWLALGLAFATGMQMHPKGQQPPMPQVFGRVLARGSQREILIAAPAGEASAPVLICEAGMHKSYDGCRKTYEAALAAGWRSEK